MPAWALGAPWLLQSLAWILAREALVAAWLVLPWAWFGFWPLGLASRLPTGPPWRYEPKLDEFRDLLEHAINGRLRLTSRNRKDLTRWAPEIARAAEHVPAGRSSTASW